MTRSIRAYRAATNCDDAAAELRDAAARALTGGRADLARGLNDQAARYERTATEWRRLAAAEGAKERAARISCWCGREVTASSYDGINCVEHDAPLSAAAAAPSAPLTPGGVR